MDKRYVTLCIEANLETADVEDWAFVGPNGEICRVVDPQVFPYPTQEVELPRVLH